MLYPSICWPYVHMLFTLFFLFVLAFNGRSQREDSSYSVYGKLLHSSLHAHLLGYCDETIETHYLGIALLYVHSTSSSQ